VRNPVDLKGPSKGRMPRLKLSALAALAGAALAAGCSQLTTRTLPKADIAHYKHVFVEHRLADSFGVADEVARQLRDMGYDASAGAITMLPQDAELVVSYDDMWTWDFNTYMIEFDMQVRLAHSDRIVAVGHYYRPSAVFGRPPEGMIHELLLKLFKHA
jgi:hypothetical protein